MKNFILLSCSLFFSIQISFAQSDEERRKITSSYDQNKLQELKDRYASEFQENYFLALKLAATKGWKHELVAADGRVSKLIGVQITGTDTIPEYHSEENWGAGVTSRANALYSGGSLGLNVTGNGMTMGLWEVNGVRSTHQLYTGRVTVVDPSSYSDHAAHVAGTIIGSPDFQGASAKGMAYEAQLRAFTSSNDNSEVTSEAANGNLLSSHSYGITAVGQQQYYLGYYDTDAKNFDEIMYYAPYYLGVFSAGNDRDDGVSPTGYDLLTDMSCSINGMVVAAVNEVSNYTGPGSVVMSAFSSWGPTDDGRIKPDISARGVSVYSAYSGSDSQYGWMSGTSMATPSTSGTLLLVQQHYNNVNGNYMKSSTLRGLTCHTADEAGNSNGPDYEFGWGLLNAKKAAEAISNEGISSIIDERTLSNGQSYTFTVTATGIEDLMATIAWTDPAGNYASGNINDRTPSLINDLDIRITKGSNTYTPWKLDPSNPSFGATTGDNIVDNIEKIHISNPSGVYTITITHKGSLWSGSQNYSLIITGATVSGIVDCNGVPGGIAFLDNCGVCVGGNTGYYPCVTIMDTAYQITGLHSGKCLSNNGTGITQNTCSTTLPEIWRFNEVQTGYYEIVSVQNGEKFKLSSIVNGTAVQSCCSTETSTDVLFRAEQGTGSAIRLVPYASMDKMLDMWAWSTSDGGPVTLWDRTTQENQQWILTPVYLDCNNTPGGAAYLDNCGTCVGGTTGSLPCVQDCNGDWGGTAHYDNCGKCVEGNTGYFPCVTITDTLYQITNLHSGKCLLNNGTGVTQNTCSNTLAEVWRFNETQTGYYEIVSIQNGDKFKLPSVNNGTAVESCCSAEISTDVMFRTEQGTSGAIRLVPYTSMDKLLDMPGWSITDGTLVGVWDRTTQENQQWILTPVYLDCNNTPGGTAYLDNCSTCVGGNTGLTACSQDCNGVFGGTAYLDNCSTCVGGNTGLTACSQDCNGVFGGTAYLDNCSTCVGGNTGLTACSQDCNGVWGGAAYLDNCSTCVGGNTGLTACSQDCNGVWGGSAYLDNCSTCVGGNTGLTACSQDCNGVFGGTAYLDNCSTCVGGNTGLTACSQDCNGVFGGTAYLDNCSTCVGGNTGLTACPQDCNGVWGGSAYLDNCSTCVGGNTGLTACSQDCNGVWGGSAYLDNCSTCVGGNTELTACSQDCNGVFGGTAYLDNCSTCVGGNTGLTACSQDCNGVFGGTAYLDNCSTCVGGNTGLTACSQDCNGVWGGAAYFDDCNTCVDGNTGLTACSQDCNGVWGGAAYLDNCSTCVGGNTGLTACSQDCNGVWGGAAYLDNCSTCVGGNTGLTACSQDCNGVWGGTAYLDNCSTCVGGNTGLTACSQDCYGEWGGIAFIDSCEICSGGNTGINPILSSEECTSSMENVMLNSAIKLYPNPANNQVYLKIDAINSVSVTIEVYSLLGKLIHNHTDKLESGENLKMITVKDWASDVYYVKVLLEGGQSIFRLVVFN